MRKKKNLMMRMPRKRRLKVKMMIVSNENSRIIVAVEADVDD